MLLMIGTATTVRCSRGYDAGEAGLPIATTQPAPTSCPAGATGPARPWQPPTATSANERIEERARIVDTQIARPSDGRRRVSDPRVIDAMRAVPRHVFVPEAQQRSAYADYPLPIGHDQTISQPYIVALMTELLEITPDTKVLEIGTGSGYQAAVLAQLTPHVYTIELLKPLADRAQQTLREQGYDRVCCRRGDGYLGWPEAAPFDAIILTCAIDVVPGPLWDQLKPGGRMVMPLGGPFEVQELVVISKTGEGQRETRRVIPVQFVPLVREKGS